MHEGAARPLQVTPVADLGTASGSCGRSVQPASTSRRLAAPSSCEALPGAAKKAALTCQRRGIAAGGQHCLPGTS